VIGAKGAKMARIVSGRDGHMIRQWIKPMAIGRAVASAGDFNNDGYPDVIVSGDNQVFVFSGKDGSGRYYETKTQQDFGHSVAGVGDVNLDGFDDYAVGAPDADDFGTDSGSVYVYSGVGGMLLYKFLGSSDGDRAGFSVCGAGDLNKDGYADILIGSPRYGSLGIEKGIVQAYSGKDGSLIGSVTGAKDDSWFGSSIAAGGDFNLDSFPDFIVGAPHDSPDFTEQGTVTAVSGKDFSKMHVWKGTVASSLFGYAIDFAGDQNADGNEDIVVGAPLEKGSGGSGAYSGVVRVFSGGTADLLKTYRGTWGANDIFGAAVAGFADVNGDGIGDVLAADPAYSGLGDDQGAVWLLSGKDYHAFAQVYGSGWPGTLGVPDLTVSAEPVLCSTIDLQLENSQGTNTAGALLIGLSSAQIQTQMGGTVLVGLPWTIVPLVIPAQGLSVPADVICDTTLAGVSVYLQALLSDSGASVGVSFSPGLWLTLGG